MFHWTFVLLNRQLRVLHFVTNINYSNARRVINSKWARELLCSFPRDMYRNFTDHFDDETNSSGLKYKHFLSSGIFSLKMWPYLLNIRTNRRGMDRSLSDRGNFFGIWWISGTLAAIPPSARKSADSVDSAHAYYNRQRNLIFCISVCLSKKIECVYII